MNKQAFPRRHPVQRMGHAVVANPPFSYRWDSSETMSEDVRFKNYGIAPKSAADFAFLLQMADLYLQF